ncbi:MAG TPA: cation transporter [Steroidobacteraceae bacterium]
MLPPSTPASLRRVVALAAALNLGFFGLEFAVARTIGSVSLFADSVDFLEDTALNTLVLMALGWRPGSKARLGMLLAALLLVPGVATLWTACHQLLAPVVPPALPLSSMALASLLVNAGCALMLWRVRHAGGSLSRAAFLSARNDAWAGIAILAAAGLTGLWHSVWPDLAVGLGILALSLDAAREVYRQARAETARARL